MMKFEIQENYPQTAHVILVNAQEKQEFLEVLEKLGAEKLVAMTSEVEEKDITHASEAMRVLGCIRRLGRCTVLEISKDTGLDSGTIEEKLGMLVKASKARGRMADGTLHYKPAKKGEK